MQTVNPSSKNPTRLDDLLCGLILDRNKILKWMQNVNTTGLLLKKKPLGRKIEAIPQETLQD